MILRYPGGKSRGKLNNMIIDHIRKHIHGIFAEPFFGGGGITISLIKLGLIKDLIIGEKDIALLDLWNKIINRPQNLIRSVKNFKPSVSQFTARKHNILNNKGCGFDALVVNRLSHGGRGVKAGPQGGYKQTGKYKIGCRWNTDKLIKEIQELHELFSNVRNIDLVSDYHCHADYYYIDPPYWEVGNQLYMHSFSKEDHFDLYKFLDCKNFLLSYNNHPEIHKLYSRYEIITTSTSGNGGRKKDSELLIYPKSTKR